MLKKQISRKKGNCTFINRIKSIGSFRLHKRHNVYFIISSHWLRLFPVVTMMEAEILASKYFTSIFRLSDRKGIRSEENPPIQRHTSKKDALLDLIA